MQTIYKTKEIKPDWDKYSRLWNEYRQDGDTVYKYKMHKTKYPEKINESRWLEGGETTEQWKTTDSNMPSWLKKYIKGT
jgi:hypothetical protein